MRLRNGREGYRGMLRGVGLDEVLKSLGCLNRCVWMCRGGIDGVVNWELARSRKKRGESQPSRALDLNTRHGISLMCLAAGGIGITDLTWPWPRVGVEFGGTPPQVLESGWYTGSSELGSERPCLFVLYSIIFGLFE